MKQQVCFPPKVMQGLKIYEESMLYELPYFSTIQSLKLYKIEKVLDIKSQSVQPELNQKPRGA